ncbi:dimethyladenosine transferase [Mycoplasma putrefaciens]|uniref:Ribosomal RNA small subunit methyltransferase A n=1 Tax=Mycoplasma putrefaciens (strain ATCC 15718 / NCTC 10155 / C30 KS-1 / KS-1) TaxID=743965 RepID=A0A7U4E940_MYCPK|nr:16S rRNA (adenine(1518)-N(6)/adenine(1519)-N(6))-dimethyltransferase RsmA [Mycoplasma putrefaciens]AEM68412.1 dimethyladenosine transferase [Mycoplasma putrefaciens KS1]SYV94646.1 dimethyladenosine transferase [Mycoplasma putrefaciens]
MQIKAKKHFGQNFISDPKLISKIVDVLGNEFDQLVIEIGPGTGALTAELVKRFKKVVVIEIDPDLEMVLKNKINSANFEIVLADVLTINFKTIIEKYHFKNVSVISNMPYYITGEILFKTFNVSHLLTKAVFMMQKEVALRICATQGQKNYNNLSVVSQFFADRKYQFTVVKGMFRPIPKVDSAIVSLTFNNQHKTKVKDQQEFIEFVRKLFNNKRKTILNNLTNLTNDKNKALAYLNKVAIDYKKRPEQLSLDEFISLFNII